MKNIFFIFVVVIFYISSCKKNVISESQLVGTWQEKAPCMRGPNVCYKVQFANNNEVSVSTPFTVTANYTLLGHNSMQLDSAFIWGPGVTGTATYQITFNGGVLTIENVYEPLRDSLGPPPSPKNLNLYKL